MNVVTSLKTAFESSKKRETLVYGYKPSEDLSNLQNLILF